MTVNDLKVAQHISQSQIKTFILCPQKYRFQYRDKIPVPFVPSSLVFGSAMHGAIADFYQMYLEGERITKEVLSSSFSDYWKAEEEVNEIRYSGEDRDSLFKMADKLLEVFIQKAQPRNVVAIEQPFKVEIEGLPALVGVIDLLEEDASGSVVIVDHKCAARRKSDFELSTDLQMSAYAIGIKALGYEQEPLLRFDMFLKSKNPDYVKQFTTRSDYDKERFINLVRAVWTAIQKDVFYPIESYMCDGCQFKEYCRK